MSFEQQSEASQRHDPQAGVELSLAVFLQSSIFLQPGEAAFDHPTPGHHLESMQFTTFGDPHYHVLTKDLLYALFERRLNIATVA